MLCDEATPRAKVRLSSRKYGVAISFSFARSRALTLAHAHYTSRAKSSQLQNDHLTTRVPLQVKKFYKPWPDPHFATATIRHQATRQHLLALFLSLIPPFCLSKTSISLYISIWTAFSIFKRSLSLFLFYLFSSFLGQVLSDLIF